jgi:hemoglobin-like flavoprotein
MSFTPREKELLRASYRHILPVAETIAKTFYHRLFDVAPEIKFLFDPTTATAQYQHFMQVITLAIRDLDSPQKIVAMMQELGQRHLSYGVRPEYYGLVGNSLMWTLRRTLLNDFPPHIESAWTKLYVMTAEAAMNVYTFQPE